MWKLIQPVYAQGVPLQNAPLNSVYGFGTLNSLKDLVGAFINPVFNIAALLVLFYFLYAGWKYLTSQGNKEELAKARSMILQAIFGALFLSLLFLAMNIFLQFFGVTDLFAV